MSTGWHVDEQGLRAYAEGSGGMAETASVEAHLLRCPDCRHRVATWAAVPLDEAWLDVQARIQSPPRSPVVRTLERIGLSESDSVLLSASRSLGGAWTIATVAVVVFAAFAAVQAQGEGRALYLLVAPLVPLLGVVGAYASTDPIAEPAAATPYPKARLGLLRTVAVGVTSVPLSIAVGVAVPGIAWLAFAWLLPAVALTLAALVGMTWWSPEPVGIAVGGAWAAAIMVAYARDDVTAVVGPQLQVVYLFVAVLAAGMLAVRLAAARTPGGYA